MLAQHELNDLVRDLGIRKDGVEYSAAIFKKKNLLLKAVTVFFYRVRDESFLKYFSADKKSSLVYCHNAEGLMHEMKPNCYEDEEWRLFIDSSTWSLKAAEIIKIITKERVLQETR